MNDDIEAALVQRWILAFCEIPALIDVELMTRLLAEHDARHEEP